jgi:hypothetical protein
MATNGPYSWGNGPKPKPKGILAKLLDLAVNGGTKKPKKGKK